MILRNAEEIWNSIPYHDHYNEAHELNWIHKDDIIKELKQIKREIDSLINNLNKP